MKLKTFHLNVKDLEITHVDKGTFRLHGSATNSYKWDKGKKKYILSNKEDIEYNFMYLYSISNGLLLSKTPWLLESEGVDKSLNKIMKGIYDSLNVKYSRKEYFTENNTTKLNSDIIRFDGVKNLNIFKIGKSVLLIQDLNIEKIVEANDLHQKDNLVEFNLKFNIIEEVRKENLVFVENRSMLAVDGVLCIKLRNQYYIKEKENRAILYNIAQGELITPSENSKIFRLS